MAILNFLLQWLRPSTPTTNSSSTRNRLLLLEWLLYECVKRGIAIGSRLPCHHSHSPPPFNTLADMMTLCTAFYRYDWMAEKARRGKKPRNCHSRGETIGKQFSVHSIQSPPLVVLLLICHAVAQVDWAACVFVAINNRASFVGKE